MSRASRFAWLVPAVITGSVIPFFVMAWRAAQERLGANPIATVLNQLGLLALLFLLLSLSCTPLRLMFRWTWPARVRRTLGLAAFFTALLHFAVYLVLDQGLKLESLASDLTKRPFIIVGFLALTLLVPLAVTSTKRAVTRLGYATWSRLHRLVYLVGILGVLHFFMRVKKDTSLPWAFALALAFLFTVRLFATYQKRRVRRQKLAARLQE